jgi:hypothetical protein
MSFLGQYQGVASPHLPQHFSMALAQRMCTHAKNAQIFSSHGSTPPPAPDTMVLLLPIASMKRGQ